MNTALNTPVATRLFSLAAAVLTTAVIAASQFGLGQHYTSLAFTAQADATLAAAQDAAESTAQKPAVAKAPSRSALPG